MGFHVGTTETGSNIQGVEEAVKLIEGKSLYIAHVNAYCRGYVEDPLLELKIVMDILKELPNIVSESHLAIHNGCYGVRDKNGISISYGLRNSLKANGCQVSKEGLEEALRVKYAGVYALVGSKIEYIYGSEAIDYWKKREYKVGVCFPINRRRSAQVCATERDKKGNFVVDAISSDAGAIPRNCILSHGLPLVRFCALTLGELVKKISLTPSRMFGLKNKGHLSIGAGADITIVDPDNAKVEIVLIKGQVGPVTPHEQISLAKQQLDLGNRELQDTSFISKFDWSGNGNKDWLIYYWPEERAKEEIKRAKIKNIDDRTEEYLPSPKEEVIKYSKEQITLIDQLVKINVSKVTAESLIKNNDQELIKKWIEAINYTNAENKAAYLVKTIRENWQFPEEYLRERKEEEQKEEREKIEVIKVKQQEEKNKKRQEDNESPRSRATGDL